MNLLLKLFPGLEAYRLLIELSLIAIACAALIGAWTYAVHKHDQKVRAEAIAPLVAAIKEQKLEAEKKLSEETAKVKAAEASLAAFNKAQNEKDAEHEITVSDLSRKLAATRLRDPARRGGGGSSPPRTAQPATGDSAKGGAQADGLFSERASAILRRLTLEADTINDAYASCRADALNIRKQAVH